MLIKPDSERIPYFILSMASENTRSLVKVDMLYVLVIHDKKDKLTTSSEMKTILMTDSLTQWCSVINRRHCDS